MPEPGPSRQAGSLVSECRRAPPSCAARPAPESRMPALALVPVRFPATSKKSSPMRLRAGLTDDVALEDVSSAPDATKDRSRRRYSAEILCEPAAATTEPSASQRVSGCW